VVVLLAVVSWGVYIGFRLLGHWPLRKKRSFGAIFNAKLSPLPTSVEMNTFSFWPYSLNLHEFQEKMMKEKNILLLFLFFK
jgi:hypothetical protein